MLKYCARAYKSNPQTRVNLPGIKPSKIPIQFQAWCICCFSVRIFDWKMSITHCNACQNGALFRVESVQHVHWFLRDGSRFVAFDVLLANWRWSILCRSFAYPGNLSLGLWIHNLGLGVHWLSRIVSQIHFIYGCRMSMVVGVRIEE